MLPELNGEDIMNPYPTNVIMKCGEKKIYGDAKPRINKHDHHFHLVIKEPMMDVKKIYYHNFRTNFTLDLFSV